MAKKSKSKSPGESVQVLRERTRQAIEKAFVQGPLPKLFGKLEERKGWVPLRSEEFGTDMRRIKTLQNKAKFDDLMRKIVLRNKREYRRTTSPLNTYKNTNLLDPWVNKQPFKPNLRIE